MYCSPELSLATVAPVVVVLAVLEGKEQREMREEERHAVGEPRGTERGRGRKGLTGNRRNGGGDCGAPATKCGSLGARGGVACWGKWRRVAGSFIGASMEGDRRVNGRNQEGGAISGEADFLDGGRGR